MTAQIITIAATALLSSLLTCGVAYVIVRRRLQPRLERRVEQALEQLGETIEERVRQGVTDGLKSVSAPEVARWTRGAVSDAAADLVKGGLSSLLGDGHKPGDK